MVFAAYFLSLGENENRWFIGLGEEIGIEEKRYSCSKTIFYFFFQSYGINQNTTKLMSSQPLGLNSWHFRKKKIILNFGGLMSWDCLNIKNKLLFITLRRNFNCALTIFSFLNFSLKNFSYQFFNFIIRMILPILLK